MEIQGKIWGATSTIFNNNNVCINRIEGIKGKCCSKHKHDHKFNLFFVEHGSMDIVVWKNDYDLVDITTLKQHDKTIVKPGEFHRFEIVEDNTVAYEIYWTELDEGDIVRETVGGETQ